MSLQAIRYQNDTLQILDQRLLPQETQYVKIRSVEDGWMAIKNMQVRGAPAIAIVGCLSLAVQLKRTKFESKDSLKHYIEDKMQYLVSARPTAVNINLASNELLTAATVLGEDASVETGEMKRRIVRAIERMLEKDINDNRAIGDNGAKAILKGSTGSVRLSVLTHCNTGSLATAGYGTALGVIRSLYDRNKLERVYCTETRPYNQGARLTAYELVYDKIPATLICDSMVAALMKEKHISAVIVGADRVASNGDTANKIGTYQIAVAAKYHSVPFYVAAPFTSIDAEIASGKDIPIEQRQENEITHISGIRIACDGITCWNPAFDVTPAALITGLITERGVYKPGDLSSVLR